MRAVGAVRDTTSWSLESWSEQMIFIWFGYLVATNGDEINGPFFSEAFGFHRCLHDSSKIFLIRALALLLLKFQYASKL